MDKSEIVRIPKPDPSQQQHETYRQFLTMIGVVGSNLREHEEKIKEFIRGDQHRNAAFLIAQWLQHVKPAYSPTGENEAIFLNLHRHYDYKPPKGGFLKNSKKNSSSTANSPIKSALDFTKALEDQRFDILTLTKDSVDLRHVSSQEKIPMHIWASVMRLYAHRGAYGKAARLFEFLHKFHVLEVPLPMNSDQYGQSILNDEICDANSEHASYRLCAYYALSAGITAQHEPSIDFVLRQLSERSIVLDEVLKAVLLDTHNSAVNDVTGFIHQIFDSLGQREADRYQDEYARARVVLRHVVRYMCKHEQYDVAFHWVNKFCQLASRGNLTLPTETLSEAIQAFTSRNRVSLAVDLAREYGAVQVLYDAAARAYTNAGDLQQLQELVKRHKAADCT
eukprot:gene24043-29094_t